ncbi:MAG: ACT domain-containing protein [Anaerovoracaceae bacterium]|jgi:hypothetical protein|nr:ACT domain-containing protein [Bacillota bacterium]
MAIQQLSVLLPNQHGTLANLTDIFYREGIDIRAISVYDTTEYGILRTVVDDPDKAVEILKKNGIVAMLSDIMAINPEDRRGSLNEIFGILAQAGVNVDYVYSFVVKKGGPQYFVLKVEDISRAEDLLAEKGIEVIKKL